MAFVVGELVAPVSADLSGFNQGLTRANRAGDKWAKDWSGRMRQVGSNMRTVGTQMTLFVTLPLVAAAAAATKAGDDMDKALKIIRAGTGAVGPDLQELGEDFKALVRTVPQSFEVVARTLASVNTRTGNTGKALQDLSKDILDLARITSADPVKTVGLITRLFGDWSVATDDQTETLNRLLRAVQATDIGLEDLAGNVVAFGAPFRLLGFSLEEGIALLSKWEKEGVNVETLLSGMRFSLGQFARTGRDANKGFAETVALIKELPTKDATELAFSVFGLRAANDMTAAIKENRFEVSELIDELRNGQDTVRAAAEDTLSLGEKFSILGNKAKLAAIPLGEEFLAALEELMPHFEDAIEFTAKLIDKFTKLPAPMKGVTIGAIALLAAAGPMLFILGGLAQGVAAMIPLWPVLAAKIATATAAITLFNVAATAGVAAALLLGLKVGSVLRPVVNEFTGFQRVLTATGPYEAQARALAENKDAYLDALQSYQRLRKELGFSGKQFRITADHTLENAEAVVVLTARLRKLNQQRIQERWDEQKSEAERKKAIEQQAAIEEELSKEARVAIAKTIDALEAEHETLKQGADAYLLHQLAALGAGDEELETARKLQVAIRTLKEKQKAEEDLTKAQNTRAREIQSIVLAVEKQYNATVLTSRDLIVRKLNKALDESTDMTEKQKEMMLLYVTSLLKGIEANEAFATAEAEAVIVKQRIMTLTEQQQAEQEKLNELYEAGALTLSEYEKAMEEVENRYDLVRQRMEDTGDRLKDYWQAATRDMQSAFADFIVDSSEGLDGLVEDFKYAIRRMLAELVASRLFAFGAQLFGGIFGNIGGGGGAGIGAEGEILATPNKDGGYLYKQDGGLLKGPGTGTSDSIPAVIAPSGRLLRVSAGEYIIKESSVKRVGVGFLDKLNSIGSSPITMANGGPIIAAAAQSGGSVAEHSGIAPDGSGGMRFAYYVDARGAAPGTEQKIVSALRSTEDRAVRRAVREVANERLRGGSFARAFDR